MRFILVVLFSLSTQLTHTATASPAPVKPGYFKGTNNEAWVKKKCRLEIHRQNEGLVVISASDSDNVYNIWMHGSELYSGHGPGIWSVSGSMRFESKNRDSGMTIFSTDSNSPGAVKSLYSFWIQADEEGNPSFFELHQFNQNKTLNKISCAELRE